MNEPRAGRTRARRWMESFSAVRRLRALSLSVVLAVLAVLVVPPGVSWAAGTASVSISPSTLTVQSGTNNTYTMTVSCSVTGGCTGTTVTFPTTTITGSPLVTDFGSWFGNSSCAGVTRTVAAGTVTYTYGNIPTGTSQCTFPISVPNFIVMNNTVVTLTPTINGSNFTSATGPSATLTLTAAPHAAIAKSAPGQVGPGGTFHFTINIGCGGAGSLGTTAYSMTDVLPANSTFVSVSNTLAHGTVSYDPATRTLTYSDPDGLVCQQAPTGGSINVTATASTNGVPDAVGDTISNSASGSFTYIDGTSGSNTATSTTHVVPVVPTPFLNKGSTSQAFLNQGQYKFNGQTFPYTYPGDWNRSGQSVQFPIGLNTVATNSGAAFAVQDPLPCLNNLSAGVYSSPAPGAPYCTAPAVIPTLLTASGFAATATDAITVVHTDGSTAVIPFTAGTGWVIPTSPAVAEIDIPPFPEEGSNTSANLQFVIKGYAAPTVATSTLLSNTATANAFLVGSTTPLVPQETATGSMMVAPLGTIAQASSGVANTSCTPATFIGHEVELTSGPSAAIYFDYLSPAGATIANPTTSFTIQPQQGTQGSSVTTAAITPTVTANYNGTGRTLLEWVIPAGAIPAAGDWSLTGSIVVNLGLGCAGTYQNDVTLGYGTALTACLSGSSLTPPSNPTANPDLRTNGSPLTGNYCGASAPDTITAVNPAFSVNKTAQGNLDATPVGSGGIGNVSPNGGTAAYNVTFTNTGQANLTNPVMYDLLPRVGDTFATSTTSRGSQFAVTLTGVGPVPTGVTVRYSQAANPCRPEVLPNASNPGCVNDWTTTAPSPLSSVTALEFLYTGTVFVSGGNGSNTFSIPIAVSTPATTPGQVAWNSVGTVATAGTGGPALPAAESSKTGLQASTASPALAKTVTLPPGPVTAVGQVVTYSFTVTNNTAVTLTGVTVNDTQTAPAGSLTSGPTCQALTSPTGTCSGSSTTLAPNQVATFTATYTVTQADLDHGSVGDTAVATGTPPTGGAVTSLTATASVPATQNPALTISKSGDVSVAHVAGDTVNYSYLVTNTGNVTLTGVGVDDVFTAPAGPAVSVTCPATPLAPGASETCTASAYTVTAADVAHGEIDNSATAHGAPPNGSPVTSTAGTWKVTFATLQINKSVSPTGPVNSGQLLTYTITVTNPGLGTYTGATFSDNLTGILDQGTLNGTPSASTGNVTVNGDNLVWTGDLSAGGTATISYNVLVK